MPDVGRRSTINTHTTSEGATVLICACAVPGACCICLQEEVDQVLQRARWDDEAEVWVLERLSDPNPAVAFSSSNNYSQIAAVSAGSRGGSSSSKCRGQQQQQQQQQGWGAGVMPGSCRPIAVLGARRPTSNFTKAAALAGDMNPRFRYANLKSMRM
jgi:hypothetical protein